MLDREVKSIQSRSNQNHSHHDDRAELQESETLERILGAIATEILPRSISMEELLNQIYQALN